MQHCQIRPDATGMITTISAGNLSTGPVLRYERNIRSRTLINHRPAVASRKVQLVDMSRHQLNHQYRNIAIRGFWVKWGVGSFTLIGLATGIPLIWLIGVVGYIYGERQLSTQLEAARPAEERVLEAKESASARAAAKNDSINRFFVRLIKWIVIGGLIFISIAVLLFEHAMH
jgi:hypothetical protein